MYTPLQPDMDRFASPESAPPEPCPTPQFWQDVVRDVQEQSRTYQVEVEGAELAVSELGTGTPLVFFPTTAGTRWLYSLTAWLLKEEFRCVLLEHPRWKHLPAAADLLPATSRVLSMAVEHASSTRADIYAAGWGGLVALRMMLDHPQLVKRALLQGTWAHAPLTGTERRLFQLGQMWPGRLRTVPLWKLAHRQNHQTWFPPFDRTRPDFLRREFGGTSVRELSGRMLSSASEDLRPLLSNLQTPVLLLRCEGEGKTVARTMDELAAGLPQATVEEMHITGHFPCLTHPNRVAKVIRNWHNSKAAPIPEKESSVLTSSVQPE